MQEIYDEHKGNYGYRRIRLELRNRGFIINHFERSILLSGERFKGRSELLRQLKEISER
ncbi:IS3 family transposase [Streptococcus thoraltensis]